MQRTLLTVLLITMTALMVSPAEARPRKETPERLYEQGLRQMKRGYYDEAIISFDKVRNHFPLNTYSVLAELRVADCLFERADYISAVDAYQQFVRLHPRHTELDYAYMRIGRSYFKQANRLPAKDQTYTELTLKSLDGYEERFEESDYLGETLEMRGKCRNRLARAEVQVGDFYFWRKSYHAASRRYVGILEEYPDSEVVDRARYRLGVSHYKMGEPDEAVILLQEVLDLQPGTQQARRAEKYLGLIREEAEQPKPPVDTDGVDQADPATPAGPDGP